MEPKVYDVIRCSNLKSLIDDVNKAIAKGWVPLGGIHSEFTPVEFFQAMFKPQSETKQRAI